MKKNKMAIKFNMWKFREYDRISRSRNGDIYDMYKSKNSKSMDKLQ